VSLVPLTLDLGEPTYSFEGRRANLQLRMAESHSKAANVLREMTSKAALRERTIDTCFIKNNPPSPSPTARGLV